MAKRAPNTGSVSRRSNGTWLAQVSIEGRRESKTFRTARDAQSWVKSKTGQIQKGLRYKSNQMTVVELLREWLEIKKTKTRLATQESYNRLANLYIIPALGQLRMKDLSADVIQTFYQDLHKQGRGPRTIILTHQVLHGFLDYAQRRGLVAENWASMVEVPKQPRREMTVWEESQVNQFLLSIRSDPYYCLFRLAFSSGMRRGELLGLKWADLDWTAGTLRISRQVYEPNGGGFVFQEPKTARGVRIIRLGKGLLDDLRYHHQAAVPTMWAIAGDSWKDHDLIFPSSVGTPINGYNLSRRFHELTRRAGLPQIRFHDIRHTAASIMLLHGEPPVRVAAILGQTVAVLLEVYTHYIQDDQQRVADLMDSITSTIQIELSQKSESQQNALQQDCNKKP